MPETKQPFPLLFAVALGLIATLLVCVIGGILLEMDDHDTPQFVVALGSTAIGALAALLVPTKQG